MTNIGDNAEISVDYEFGATNARQTEAEYDAAHLDVVYDTDFAGWMTYRVYAKAYGDSIVTFWDSTHTLSASCIVHVPEPETESSEPPQTEAPQTEAPEITET